MRKHGTPAIWEPRNSWGNEDALSTQQSSHPTPLLIGCAVRGVSTGEEKARDDVCISHSSASSCVWPFASQRRVCFVARTFLDIQETPQTSKILHSCCRHPVFYLFPYPVPKVSHISDDSARMAPTERNGPFSLVVLFFTPLNLGKTCGLFFEINWYLSILYTRTNTRATIIPKHTVWKRKQGILRWKLLLGRKKKLAIVATTSDKQHQNKTIWICK